MPLSQSEREILVARVQQKLSTRSVSRTTVEAVVERVAALLDVPDESAVPAPSLIAFSAESMPDLASRVRQRLALDGVTPMDSGVATEGRHTVLTLKVAPGAVSRAEAAARALGLRLTVIPSALEPSA